MNKKVMILLYNKNINDSITYQCVKHLDIDIIVFDNSIKDYKTFDVLKNTNIKYYNMNENVGLSKAYNYVFDTLDKSRGYLYLFDDDTQVDVGYFDVVNSIIEKEDVDIIVPKVISAHNNRIYSPRIKRGVIHAINSGLVIKNSIYNNYRYNEELFLYFADLDFFNSNKEKNIKCIDYYIVQNFSEFENRVLNAGVIKQLNLRYIDARVYFKWYKYYPYIFIFSFLKFAWYRDIKVMKLLFKNINYWEEK